MILFCLANPQINVQYNIARTVALSEDAGFTVHHNKSVLVSTQEIVHMGFILNSKNMTVALTPGKSC